MWCGMQRYPHGVRFTRELGIQKIFFPSDFSRAPQDVSSTDCGNFPHISQVMSVRSSTAVSSLEEVNELRRRMPWDAEGSLQGSSLPPKRNELVEKVNTGTCTPLTVSPLVTKKY